MAEYVYATFSTWVTPTVQMHKGEIWDASDPVVRSHPDWFTDSPEQFARRSGPIVEEATDNPPLEPKADKRPAVESATAAPGERRTVPRAR